MPTPIETYAAAVKPFHDRQGAAIDGLITDVAALNATIKALQDSAGTITPSDQALLDTAQSQASDIADRLDTLDNDTPPTPPVA